MNLLKSEIIGYIRLCGLAFEYEPRGYIDRLTDEELWNELEPELRQRINERIAQESIEV